MGGLEGSLLAGRYRIERRLGAGGMGEVFEATDEERGERVALKRIFPHFADEADLVERFEREARAVARLSHPHVVQLLDFARPRGEPPFLVMELLRGRTLRTIVQEDGPLPLGRAVKIALQVLDALDATHEAGVVHRDIKPDNVFIATAAKGGDLVKLLDFGVAKAVEDRHDVSLTETGALVGTLAFMAPEQARGEEVDARADLYGVGALLYYAVLAQKPHEARGSAALLEAVLHELIVPLAVRDPEIPLDFSSVVERALAAEVDDRLPSAEAMIAALEPFVGLTYAADAPVADREPDRTAPRRRRRARSRASDDAETIQAARAMLAAETKPSARATTAIAARRPLLLGVSGIAACAIVYVFAIRDRPTPVLAPSGATSAKADKPTAELPVDTQTAALKRRLAAALKARDAAACVGAFAELDAVNSAEADGVRQLGAACTMLTGDCDAGRAQFRAAVAHKAHGRAADTIELQGERMAAANCPRDQLTPPERALAAKQDLANATETALRLDAALALARAVAPLPLGAHFRAECLDTLREAIVELVDDARCDDARTLEKEVIGLDAPRMKPALDALARCP